MKTPLLIKKIGSMTEGLSIRKRNSQIIKNFYLISHLKKIFFMFAIVCLYNKPIYQIGSLCLLTQIMLLIHIFYLPLKEREEQIKCLICEAFILLALFLMFLFAVEEEFQFTSMRVKFNIGWTVIGCCLSALTIQIIVDIKIHVCFMIKVYKRMRPL